MKPGNIVGAIANEADIDSKFIGRIQIFDNYSLVDLPEGMPKEILQHLKKVWVAGQELRISLQRPGGKGERSEESNESNESSDHAAGGMRSESPFNRAERPQRKFSGANKTGPPASRGPRKNLSVAPRGRK